MTTETRSQTYQDLLVRYLPRPIHSDLEAEAVQRVMDDLIDSPQPLSRDQEDFLELLGGLIFLWEDNRFALPHTPPHEIVRALIEDNGLRQRDLVGPVFPTESIASEVLSGKRKLTYDFVARLSGYFHVSPAIFYPLPD